MKKQIYLDHASTTPVDPRVLKEMLPYFSKNYGNPSSLHTIGIQAKETVDISRSKIAKILNCQPEEIIFTGSGTESINLAIKGVSLLKQNLKSKGHIITSSIEHPAVLNTCKYLETIGIAVTYLQVDKYGLISKTDVEKNIRQDTFLISIMYANNEIGTIQPIAEIGKIARQHNILFHTDACQAAGALDLDVKKLNVDLLTINASKIYGPKGTGLLYKRKDIPLQTLILGGGQEQNLRSGTENVPAIVGFAKTLELAQAEKDKENKRLIRLRNYFIEKTIKEIPQTKLNGNPILNSKKIKSLPNNAHLSFKDIDGESLMLYLNQKGIFISTGSACTSLKIETSHVLKAIGLDTAYAQGSIRFTLGKSTTKTDLDYTIKCLKEIVRSLRMIK
ncbi:cysteine desulfurase [Candidatus Woesearchaeota archaeon]|nr:cysteine desulfurase [Candidatus Woesearchaeota archaeon]